MHCAPDSVRGDRAALRAGFGSDFVFAAAHATEKALGAPARWRRSREKVLIVVPTPRECVNRVRLRRVRQTEVVPLRDCAKLRTFAVLDQMMRTVVRSVRRWSERLSLRARGFERGAEGASMASEASNVATKSWTASRSSSDFEANSASE